MKKALCMLAGVLAVCGGGYGDEAGMKAILSDWNLRESDWQSAFGMADSEARKEELLKGRPDAVRVAAPLWREVSRDLSCAYVVPAVVWFLAHPDALAEAFPSGDQARKILLKCMDALERNLIAEKGVGAAAFALSRSSDLRCRMILEKMRNVNPHEEDQGLAALGLALIMKNKTDLQQDDLRLMGVRSRLLKEAILKCFDCNFGPYPVKDVVKEELYEFRTLCIGQVSPGLKLPSTTTGTEVMIPNGEKPVLLAFWNPQDIESIKFLGEIAALRDKYPDVLMLPVALGNRETVSRVLADLGAGFPSLYDEGGAAFRDFRIQRTPWVYMLDVDGKVLMRGRPNMLLEVNLEASLGKGDRNTDQSPEGNEVSPLRQREDTSVSRPASQSRPQSVPQVSPAAPVKKTGSSSSELEAPPLRPIPE